MRIRFVECVPCTALIHATTSGRYATIIQNVHTTFKNKNARGFRYSNLATLRFPSRALTNAASCHWTFFRVKHFVKRGLRIYNHKTSLWSVNSIWDIDKVASHCRRGRNLILDSTVWIQNTGVRQAVLNTWRSWQQPVSEIQEIRTNIKNRCRVFKATPFEVCALGNQWPSNIWWEREAHAPL